MLSFGTNTYALPTWETYKNPVCGITLKHPYLTDKITNEDKHIFEINSLRDQSDPDSINMTITGSCLDKPIPITKEMINLTDASLRKNFMVVTYDYNKFNKTNEQGGLSSSVSIGGFTDNSGLMRVNSVVTTIQNNMTYIIKLFASGDDGNSGFINNYEYLEDNILGSLNFAK
jgi:hypothetical protein